MEIPVDVRIAAEVPDEFRAFDLPLASARPGGHNPVMSTHLSMPEVIDRLQRLSPEDMAVIERVLTQLEINRTVAELDDLTDDLRANGMMAKLPQIIREVRERHTDGA
jgi:hypothetical protein